MMTAYNAWIMEQPFGLTEEFRALYSKYFRREYLQWDGIFYCYHFLVEKHGIDEGRADMVNRQIQSIIEEQEVLNNKSSQIEVCSL